MTGLEFKFALVFALFFVAFTLRWAFGARPLRWRRRRFWPPERTLGSRGSEDTRR